MEKIIQIPTNDGYLIDGTLNYMNEDKKKLIILVHGLPDNKIDRIVFNASKFFKTKGYDTFRFSLYSGCMGDKGRVLEDCSIGTFIEDINSVIYHFQGKYEKIYLACHSLGFVVLDCDLKSITKVALWDPCLSLKREWVETLEYNPSLKAYSINWGVSFLIGRQLKIDWENINDERLLRNTTTPLCILMAEDSDLKLAWRKNLKHLNVEHIYKEIKGASHDFCEEGIDDYLYEETLEWYDNDIEL